MATLAARLKALNKRVAALEQDSDPAVQAVLLRLEACLDEIDKVLPPTRRGRPKQPDLLILPWFVDSAKKLGMKTDKAVLQRLLRGDRGSLKTWQNQLAKARKLLH
ncbi:hypothetical protein F3I62_03530 [Pseudomonas sp. R-28-1W-6]|uniref:hypothetical protein n=1 Tax=Pseudomonas sp. R-28-1W-6 TaxID=2650101 RepID=UPI0013651B62|nr:hypothetical protein [Pseudomonas sp. R-28-1W-6]MWV11159.1 hypothetical protein [Pseudomonas sp. R-28-1W-6]